MGIPDHCYAQCAPAEASTYPRTSGIDVYFCYKTDPSGMPLYQGGQVYHTVVLDEGELPEDLRHLQVMLVDDELDYG